MARCNCTMFGTSVAAVSLDPGLRAKRCPEIPRGCGVFKHDSLSTLPSLASRPDKSGCSSVCLCIAQTNLFQKASDPWKEDPNKSPRYEKKMSINFCTTSSITTHRRIPRIFAGRLALGKSPTKPPRLRETLGTPTSSRNNFISRVFVSVPPCQPRWMEVSPFHFASVIKAPIWEAKICSSFLGHSSSL